jgi:hypothetical protein
MTLKEDFQAMMLVRKAVYQGAGFLGFIGLEFEWWGTVFDNVFLEMRIVLRPMVNELERRLKDD